MRRLELLIKEVRQSSDTDDINSISDFELMRYFNDAQKSIQNVIYQSNSSADVFVKEYLLGLEPEVQQYPLPLDIYAKNSVVSVSLTRDGRIYQPLKRAAYREKEVVLGYSLLGNNLVLTSNPSTMSARQLIMTYNYRLPLLSLRVGKISAVDNNAKTITLGSDYLSDFYERHEYISIVDKFGNRILDTDSLGNQIQKNLYIDSFNQSTFVITTDGDLSNVDNTHYVVMGENSCSHPFLPEECEPFLLAHVQRRILSKISSEDVIKESAFTAEERQDIITLFEDNVKDILYPVSTDRDYMGY